MATAPFAAPFEASLKETIQGGQMELLSGHVVYPQYFCCVTCTNVGVPKAPVGLIRADDTYVCTGAPVCIDILGSWSPTSTLASYNVDWDDGNNSPGAWPPAGDICHPLGGYAVAGIYDVTLTVTDLLGVTDSDIVQIEVVDCPCDAAPAFLMVGGRTAGPFYTEILAGGATVWNGLDIASLIAAGSRRCNVLTEYHWLDGHISIFMGTGCGIYEYVVPAVGSLFGGTWSYLLDPVDMLGAVGINGTFDVWDIKMSMENEGWGYCCYGVLNWPDMWCVCAHTRDGWQTVHTATIVSNDNGSDLRSMCSIAQHSNGETIYVTTPAWGGRGTLYRSLNHAVTFTRIDGLLGATEQVVHVPWNSPGWSDSIIYWGWNGMMRRSTDGGATFANLVNMGRPQRMYGPTYNANWIYMQTWTPGGFARYWDPVGGLVSFGPQMCWPGCHCLGGGVLTYGPGCFPATWLLCGETAGNGRIYLNTSVGQTSCTGDWGAKTGNAFAFCMIHRTPEPVEFDRP